MLKDYRHYLKKKTDKELILMLFIDKKKYDKQSILVAKEIIKERKLTRANISKIRKEIRKEINAEKRISKKEAKNNNGCFGLLVELISMGFGKF